MWVVMLRAVTCACSAVVAFFGAQAVQHRLEVMRARLRPVTLDEVLHDQVLCFALFAAVGLVVSAAVSLWVAPACLAIAWMLSKRAPAFVDRRKRLALRCACEEGLDVLADTVSMGVRAGLTFDAALELYCAKFDGPLAREMSMAHLQWKSGIASRSQALTALAQKVGSKALGRFADTVVQSIEFGAPLAQSLTTFACEMRKARRAQIERRVEKAPVKMLVPMGVCILPAMLILVMGPVLLQFMESGM